MSRHLAFALLMLPGAISSSPVKIGLFTCSEMVPAGPRQFVIDAGYLLKTRMMRDLPDDQVFNISRLITSGVSSLDFRETWFGEGRYRVEIGGAPAGVEGVTAWVSDRTRDGVCAIELEGLANGQRVQEFLQILAVYPGGTLALGLPNTEDRVGLILLVNRRGQADGSRGVDAPSIAGTLVGA